MASRRVPLRERIAAATPEQLQRADRIVNENRPLARWAVGKWGFMCPDVEGDDLESRMLEALWIAAFDWDPSIATLGTYAGNRMKWVAMHLRQRPHPDGIRFAPPGYQALRLDQPMADGMTLADVIVDPSDQLEPVESEADVYSLTLVLTERERAIISRRADGWTLDEVASEFGISRQRVHQIVRNAGRRLAAAA